MYLSIAIHIKIPLDKKNFSINNVYMQKDIYNLLDYQAKFEDYLVSEKYGSNTVKSYICDLNNYFDWLVISNIIQKIDQLSKNQFLNSISNRALEQYIANNFLSQPKSTAKKRAIAVQRFQNFLTNEFGFITTSRNHIKHHQNQPSFAQILKSFGLFLSKNGNSARTIKQYTSDIKEYLQISSLS